MKALIWIFVLFCSGCLLASDDGVAEEMQMIADAEKVFFDAIARADTITVWAVEGRTEKRLLWTSSDPGELQLIRGAIRFLPPRVETRVINGVKRSSVVHTSCYCYGQLWVGLSRQNEELLMFLVLHGKKIGNEALGGFEIDAPRFAPFYDRMIALAKEPNPESSVSATEGTPSHK